MSSLQTSQRGSSRNSNSSRNSSPSTTPPTLSGGGVATTSDRPPQHPPRFHLDLSPDDRQIFPDLLARNVSGDDHNRDQIGTGNGNNSFASSASDFLGSLRADDLLVIVDSATTAAVAAATADNNTNGNSGNGTYVVPMSFSTSPRTLPITTTIEQHTATSRRRTPSGHSRTSVSTVMSDSSFNTHRTTHDASTNAAATAAAAAAAAAAGAAAAAATRSALQNSSGDIVPRLDNHMQDVMGRGLSHQTRVRNRPDEQYYGKKQTKQTSLADTTFGIDASDDDEHIYGNSMEFNEQITHIGFGGGGHGNSSDCKSISSSIPSQRKSATSTVFKHQSGKPNIVAQGSRTSSMYNASNNTSQAKINDVGAYDDYNEYEEHDNSSNDNFNYYEEYDDAHEEDFMGLKDWKRYVPKYSSNETEDAIRMQKANNPHLPWGPMNSQSLSPNSIRHNNHYPLQSQQQGTSTTQSTVATVEKLVETVNQLKTMIENQESTHMQQLKELTSAAAAKEQQITTLSRRIQQLEKIVFTTDERDHELRMQLKAVQAECNTLKVRTINRVEQEVNKLQLKLTTLESRTQSQAQAHLDAQLDDARRIARLETLIRKDRNDNPEAAWELSSSQERIGRSGNQRSFNDFTVDDIASKKMENRNVDSHHRQLHQMQHQHSEGTTSFSGDGSMVEQQTSTGSNSFGGLDISALEAKIEGAVDSRVAELGDELREVRGLLERLRLSDSDIRINEPLLPTIRNDDTKSITSDAPVNDTTSTIESRAMSATGREATSTNETSDNGVADTIPRALRVYSSAARPFREMGLWVWCSGRISRKRSLVPWNIETYNSSNVMQWTKDATSVKVLEQGVYELRAAVFARSKPALQVLVDGVHVVSAVRAPAHVVHRSGMQPHEGNAPDAGVAGSAVVAQLCLASDTSTVSVRYRGGEHGHLGHGFLLLARIV